MSNERATSLSSLLIFNRTVVYERGLIQFVRRKEEGMSVGTERPHTTPAPRSATRDRQLT
jgi:hypothetical protein